MTSMNETAYNYYTLVRSEQANNSLLENYERLLVELRNCQETNAEHPITAPWSNIVDDIAELERNITELRTKINTTVNRLK